MGMGWSGHNGFGVNGSGAGLSTNNATAANLTYGIGVGVATNGQTTLLAIGGAVAGTYVTTGAGHAVASGQTGFCCLVWCHARCHTRIVASGDVDLVITCAPRALRSSGLARATSNTS